ncbi:hypothetical protein GcM1_172013 [Golovinomyces cichoracearum]|uniref:Urease accessory protein n=1 Tax=Golovinomyces cichoracearum TaxID=62708 RepID=A0A420J6J9_9PEZI|nr:hypothetical protein GcM1_172013 [Golovinomyces cichoracearum]
MPHKHTRNVKGDKSTSDLPPTQVAQPLPVSKSASVNGIFSSKLATTKKSRKKRKHKQITDDDTPKGFLRLMALYQGKKPPNGLDDGKENIKSAKRRKLPKQEVEPTINAKTETEIPKIRPGEKMSEFGARVDAALPISGLINKSSRKGVNVAGIKKTQTRTEKRMQKMYAEWRLEEARIRDRRQEIEETVDEQLIDEDGQVKWKADVTSQGRSIKKNKKNKRKKLAVQADSEEDPWLEIQKNRGEKKYRFNEVVQAPPKFLDLPKEKFMVIGTIAEVYDTPKASGSLRRREELGKIRKTIVAEYRAKAQHAI